MRISISSYLWIIPFISFFIGYQTLRLIFYSKQVQTPNVLGLNLNDAIKKLSSYQLNVRILKEKEDSDLPEGTIISQSPEPLRNIKPYQSVFLVITCKKPPMISPNMVNLTLEEAQNVVDKKGLNLKKYYLESSYPSDTIIAQIPESGQNMTNDIVTVYVSAGSSSVRVFPDLVKKTVKQAKEFLNEYDLDAKIYHENESKAEGNQNSEPHDCKNCIIINQIPLPGTLVDLKKTFTVQLTVKS